MACIPGEKDCPTSNLPFFLSWTLFIAVLVLLYYTLPGLFLRTFLPSITIDNFTWRNVNGIHWQYKRDQYTIKVSISKARWVFNNGLGNNRGWLGVLIKGVRVRICQSNDNQGLCQQRQTAPPHNQQGQQHQQHQYQHAHQFLSIKPFQPIINSIKFGLKIIFKYLKLSLSHIRSILLSGISKLPRSVRRTTARILRLLRHRIARPLVSQLYALGRNLSYVVGLFFVDFVDIVIEAEQVMAIHTSFRTGLEVRRGAERRLSVWLRLIDLYVSEWESPTKESEQQDDNCFDDLPAIHIRDPIRFDISVPFNPSIGVAGIYKRDHNRDIQLRDRTIDIVSSYTHGVHDISKVDVRIQKLIAISQAAKCAFPKQQQESTPSSSNKKNDDDHTKHRPNPLRHLNSLRQIQLNFPALSLIYHFPSSTSTQQSPFDIRLNASGLSSTLLFGSNLDNSHSAWLDSKTAFEASAKFGWRSLELGIHHDCGQTSAKVTPHSKFFTAGASSISISSMWIPLWLASGLKPLDNAVSFEKEEYNRDFANNVTVVDANIGALGGDISLDHMKELLYNQSFLEILQKKKSEKGKQKAKKSDEIEIDNENENTDKQLSPHYILPPPRLIFSTQISHGKYQIAGLPSTKKIDKSDDNLSNSSILHIHLPRVSLNAESECVDMIYMHTEASRRKMRRMVRNTRLPYSVPDSLRNVFLQDCSFNSNASDTTSLPSSPKLQRDESTSTFATTTTSSSSTSPVSFFNPVSQITNSTYPYDPKFPFTLQYKTKINLSTAPAHIYLGSALRHEDRIPIMLIGPLSSSSTLELFGETIKDGKSGRLAAAISPQHRRGNVGICIAQLAVELWRPVAISCLSELGNTFTDFNRVKNKSFSTSSSSPSIAQDSPSTPTPTPKVSKLPHDISFHFSLENCNCLFAGHDENTKPSLYRGVALSVNEVSFEYFLQTSRHSSLNVGTSRNRLDLLEDIETHANSLYTQDPNERSALFKLSCDTVDLIPVADAELYKCSDDFENDDLDIQPQDDAEPAQWELKNRASAIDFIKRRKSSSSSTRKDIPTSIIHLPSPVIRCTIRQTAQSKESPLSLDVPVDDITLAIETPLIGGRFDMTRIYCLLIAIASLLNLKRSITKSTTSDSAPSLKPTHPPALVSLRAETHNLHLFVNLPHDVRLFAAFRYIEIQKSHSKNIRFLCRSCLLAGQSPTVKGCWDDILRGNSIDLTFEPAPTGQDIRNATVNFNGDAVRLRIPYQYHLYLIFDNIATLFKACKQLVHQVIKGNQDSIIHPHAEKAKKMPNIFIRVHIISFEMMDDPLETSLNRIWRVGRDEQRGRMARDHAFSMKATEENDIDNTEEGSHIPRDIDEISKARDALDRYNARNWIDRVRNARAEQRRREDALVRKLNGRMPGSRSSDDLPVEIVQSMPTAPLFRASINQVDISLKAPSFGEDGLADYLHDVGKGLPKDTKFSLLLPFNINWRMNEARVSLRDYPLPLLHIPPAFSSDDENNTPSWNLETDFVIAEELHDSEDSTRHVSCQITPNINSDDEEAGVTGYTMTIPRSAMPTKFYSLPRIQVSSTLPTRICWGNSIQPSIQDVSRTFETVSKPPLDPSERIGIWDKVRLIMHGNIKVDFVGDGDVHLYLKGERDPYALSGNGAGFVMCWRKNVQILFGLDNPDREFLQVKSDEFLLAIPDLREWVDDAATGLYRESPVDSDSKSGFSNAASFAEGPSGFRRYPKDEFFTKVAAKFINGVRWGMAVVLERTCQDVEHCGFGCTGLPFYRKCRLFDFIPHWDVKTVTRESVKDVRKHDSYRGFRSDFIHFSLSITSPTQRTIQQSQSLNDSSSDYNSLHFSPESVSHFWAWWGLFNGTLSLPIRHGKLFPQSTKPSKKFGRHCATIKYRFSLSPLFMAHTYRQDDVHDWQNGETVILGLKGKVNAFNVDLHQRAQEITVLQPELNKYKKTIRKRFYIAEVDCEDVDLRVVSARFREPEKQYIVTDQIGMPETDDVDLEEEDYKISDNDLKWVDMDDYTDLQTTFTDENPKLRILQMVTSPRFTYVRKPPDVNKTRSVGNKQEGEQIITKFGKEDTHTCLIGNATDTVDVQISVTKKRLEELESQFSVESNLETNYLANTMSGTHSRETELTMRIDGTKRILRSLLSLKEELTNQVRVTESDKQDTAGKSPLLGIHPKQEHTGSRHEDDGNDYLPHLTSKLYSEWDTWINRIILHNPLITFNNGTRDIALRYYFLSRTRRGFCYQMTARAIKFIRDLSDEAEQKRRQSQVRSSKARQNTATYSQQTRPTQGNVHQGHRKVTVDEIMGDHDHGHVNDFVTEETQEKDPLEPEKKHIDPETDATYGLPDYCELRNRFLFMMIKPQIALTSKAEDDATVVLTAFRAELKSFQVTDIRYRDDPVNSVIMHRSFGTLDGLQAFYPRPEQKRSVDEQNYPFLPTEVLIDLRLEPWGFDRVVPRTTANLRLDEFNRYRIRQGVDLGEGDENFRNGTNRLVVHCSSFSATANPQHFNAIYNVITDLILYTDPAQRTRSHKLEDIMLVHDWNNLGALAAKLKDYQDKIRRRDAIITSYRHRVSDMSNQARIELFGLKSEILILANEMSLLCESVNMAQGSKQGGDDKSSGFQIDASASQIAWHMVDNNDSPIAKLAVMGVNFSWLSKRDSTASNRLLIKDLQALNSSPEQVFTEILAKNTHDVKNSFLAKKDVFAIVIWNTLSPVGGIEIVEHFELHLHPIRLQLEHVVGKKIVDYVFERRRQNKERATTSASGSSDNVTTKSMSSKTKDFSSKSSMHMLQPFTSADKDKQSISSLSRHEDSDNEVDRASIASSSVSGHSSFYPYNHNASTSSLHSVQSTSTHTHHPEVQSALSVDDDDHLDVVEMRRRARANRAFVLVEVAPTILALSYKGEKQSSLYDVYDLTFALPRMNYRNQVLSYLDLLDAMKKDVTKSVWTQTPKLLNQLVTHARKPKVLTTMSNHGEKSHHTFRKMKKVLTLHRSNNSNNNRSSSSSGDNKTQQSSSPLQKTFSASQLLTEEPESINEVNEGSSDIVRYSPEPIDDDNDDDSDQEKLEKMQVGNLSQHSFGELVSGERVNPPQASASAPTRTRGETSTTADSSSSGGRSGMFSKKSTKSSSGDKKSSAQSEMDKARLILGKSMI